MQRFRALQTDISQAHGAVLNARGTELFVSGNTQGIIPGYDGDSELFVWFVASTGRLPGEVTVSLECHVSPHDAVLFVSADGADTYTYGY